MPVVQQGLAQTGLYADQGKPQGPMNVSPGGAVIDPSTGKLIYQNNNFAPQRPIWDSVRGGWVMPPGGGQQSMPSPPAGQSNVQFDFAEGTSPEVQAAIRAAASADQAGQMPPGAEMPQEAPVRPGPGFIPVVPPRQPAGAAKVEVPGNPALHGDAYLATLPPEMRSLVKAIADGNQAPPSASSRSPQAQALLQAVYAYDPSMSAINLPARTQTRKDFTSGKSAQNLRALNQAIGHLGMLNGQIGGTAGHSIPVIGHMVNEAQNAYAYASGDPGITNFKQTAAALAGELTQVFRGNSGAEADLARFLQELDAANSTEQKTAAVRNIVGLLNSRIEELGQQYSQGMGKITDPYSLLNPHAAEVLRGVMGGGKQGKGAQKAGWAIEEVP